MVLKSLDIIDFIRALDSTLQNLAVKNDDHISVHWTFALIYNVTVYSSLKIL